MSEKTHPFVMFPSRIWHLPGITIQLLKFYEKIFQFWHQGYECFLSNKTLMEYAGMKSDSTVRDAFTYFESHGELKRVMKNGKRYIIPPQPRLSTDSVDNLPENSINSDQPSATALGGERCSAGGGSAVALDNNINIIKEFNKKLLPKNEQKKFHRVDNSKRHDFADSMDQMASEARNIEIHQKRKQQEIREDKRSPMPQALRDQISLLKRVCGTPSVQKTPIPKKARDIEVDKGLP